MSIVKNIWPYSKKLNEVKQNLNEVKKNWTSKWIRHVSQILALLTAIYQVWWKNLASFWNVLLSNSCWHGEIFTCVIRRATLFHKSLLKFPSVGLISEVPLLTLAVKFGSWNNFQPSRVPKSSWNLGLNNTVIFSASKKWAMFEFLVILRWI